MHHQPHLPFVSVVIPAYNEERHIGRCLASLMEQDYGGPWEVVVVDNASHDRTAEVARRMGARTLYCGRRGVVYAREVGFRASRGDIVVQTDADCTFPKDWLTRLVGILATDPRLVAVAGEVDYEGEPLWHRPISSAARLTKRVWFRLRRRPLSVFGANMAIARPALVRVGGYGEELPAYGDEQLLLQKLSKVGRVTYAPDVRVATSSRRFRGRPWRLIVADVLTRFFLPVAALYLTPLVRRRAREFAPLGRSSMLAIAAGSLVLTLLVGLAIYGYLMPSSSLYGKVYSRQRTNEMLVALTFDDGPDAVYTEEVLRVLAEYGVPATFFVQGASVSQNPDLAARIV